MSTITTRSGKGSPLTNTEVDDNFTNLNDDKLEKSGGTMTGDLTGTQATTSASWTVLERFFANPAAESGEQTDVRLINDLAGFNKWGTETLTDIVTSHQGSTALTTLGDEPFDGSSSTRRLYQNANGDPNVILLELPHALTYSCWVGIVFGATNWRTKSVKIETFRNGAWQTECDLTNQSSHIVARRVASNNNNGVTKIRYTLDDYQNTSSNYARVHTLFAVNYQAGNNPEGGVHYLSRYKDDEHYSNIAPAIDSTYALGTSSQRYSNVYSDALDVNGDLTFQANADITTANNANLTIGAGGTGDTIIDGLKVRFDGTGISDANLPLAITYTGSDLYAEPKAINTLNPSGTAFYPTGGIYPAGTLVIGGSITGGTATVDLSSLVDIVTDTTPQLGGDLDMNGNDITGSGNLTLTSGDFGTFNGDIVTFSGRIGCGGTGGTNGDIFTSGGAYGDIEFDASDGEFRFDDDVYLSFQDSSRAGHTSLFYDAGRDHFRIHNRNAADTTSIETDNLQLMSQGTLLNAEGETYLTATKDGSVDIYYDDAKKFETTTDGVKITGHTDTTSIGNLASTGSTALGNLADDEDVIISAKSSSLPFVTILLRCEGSTGEVHLNYQGAKKLATTNTGVQTTGTVNVNGAYTLPTSDGTNGQVLTTDGSGAVTFQDASGGGGVGEGKALVFANLFG